VLEVILGTSQDLLVLASSPNLQEIIRSLSEDN
jgi:hypothetical protein